MILIWVCLDIENLQKVNQTLPALEGAFSQFDEVAIYTYSGTVRKNGDFGAVGKRLDAVSIN